MQYLLTQEEFDALKGNATKEAKNTLQDFLLALALQLKSAPKEPTIYSSDVAFTLKSITEAIQEARKAVKL